MLACADKSEWIIAREPLTVMNRGHNSGHALYKSGHLQIWM